MDKKEAQEKVTGIVQEIFGQSISEETKELIVNLIIEN
jgi:hypothetical protein